MSMAPRYHELRDMTDEELAERYDRAAENASEGIAFYLDEIVRRDLVRAVADLRIATERLDSARRGIERWGLWLAIVATAATIGQLIAAID